MPVTPVIPGAERGDCQGLLATSLAPGSMRSPLQGIKCRVTGPNSLQPLASVHTQALHPPTAQTHMCRRASSASADFML